MVPKGYLSPHQWVILYCSYLSNIYMKGEKGRNSCKYLDIFCLNCRRCVRRIRRWRCWWIRWGTCCGTLTPCWHWENDTPKRVPDRMTMCRWRGEYWTLSLSWLLLHAWDAASRRAGALSLESFCWGCPATGATIMSSQTPASRIKLFLWGSVFVSAEPSFITSVLRFTLDIVQFK